ncbi:unnamed protein product [Cladocopium goreaui]|uniref:Regulator of nonsense transcripts 1-like n=1 Tax=Cladocopium goreaui TaxID=2562237 RepID=A0A9P1CNI5_9DINO|nr:unnamed protein product [Cladocopium goreaui]
MKRYKLHETRIAAVQRGAEHVGYQTFAGDPPIIATAAQHSKRKPTAHAASPIALPWYEHDSEADASDAANSPRSDRPLGPREEDSDGGSDTYSEPPIPPCDGIESSCAAAPNDWEERMARQPSTLDSLKQLPGLVVFGTFRSTGGKEALKRAGEVIVHRGPAALQGCKVRIWGNKTRGPTWDFDRCYVQILDARVWGPSRKPSHGSAIDVERMEFFGCIWHAIEFGVPRQKLFVCMKPKVVHNPKHVAFKPINGKLPAIQVPWKTASKLPGGHDLHVVEVCDWSGDSCPRGRYLKALKMKSRHTDMSILKAVQISLNFCDWPRGDPRNELTVDFPQPARRRVADSGLTVGISHPDLPTGMLMSCGEDEFYMHVLDVNAYLDALGMEKVENLLRQRSVGAWFLDHLDNPLEANLPLFPPNIEAQLTFKPGVERHAVTFTIQVPEFKVSAVDETTVRCNHILSPQEAGVMILSDKGGDVGQVLRSLHSHMAEIGRADLARGNGSALEHLLVAVSIPGPLLATQQLLHSCISTVERYIGTTLAADAWKKLLDDEEDAELTVRYVHGRAEPSTRKVIERLLRVKQSDRDKDIHIEDVIGTLREILQQPGLTNAQKHAMRSSFLRRLHAALPAAYYEVIPASSEYSSNTGDWWHPEPRFHVTSPLHRYIDILGMRALKSQLGWTASNPHLLLSRRDFEEAVARTNCRIAAESFGRHIFRTISRMRELSGSGQKVSDAVIGAVGPTYINILVPSEKAHTLELQLPVSSLCSSTCVSEYDAVTQSMKLTMQNDRDHLETLRIRSWFAQRMTCVIARNYAQPIPHHASPNSIVLWEIKFHGEKDFIFPTGLKSFPESFSSWPDLTDWPLLDRKMETYSQVWSRIKLCQVHAAALSSDAYTSATSVNDLKWFRTSGASHFECQVEVKLLQYQRLQPGDLVVLSLERACRPISLQGILLKAKGTNQMQAVEDGKKSFIVQVELSKISELSRQAQDFSLDGASTWRLHFILIPPNEKKCIQLLQDMPRSCPLQGMRLTIPRSTKEIKREMEMRPLVSISEVTHAMHSTSKSKLNGKQTLAIQRALQRPFSMVQGPPGTGKTSMLVQCVAALLTASRPRWKDGRILVCAPSNHAADHILDRLMSAGIPPHYVTRVYSRFIERCHGSGYKGGTTKSEGRFEIQPHLQEHALHWKVSQSPKVKFLPWGRSQYTFNKSYESGEVQILRDSRIVITTCMSAYLHTALVKGEPPHVVRPVSFDSIVIDEAAQASEPDIVLPATSANCRVIVVGDHKQLGPVVTEHNLCAPYVSALETPFLERMHQNSQRSMTSTMLNEQYRMHPSIRSFPSSQFYESMLEDRVSISHRPQLNGIWPQKKDHRIFIDCQTPQSMGLSPELTGTCDVALMESKVSLKNVGEARSVVAACAALLRQRCDPRDIAVITPYKAQQHEIRARLARDKDVGSHSKSILVGTVHALQGSEREYIIVSFVRSTSQDEEVVTSVAKTAGDSVALQEMYQTSLGILENYRVLNVAITRAKYGLICLGNADVLSKGSKDFNAFIHSLRSCRCILSQKDFKESVRKRRA